MAHLRKCIVCGTEYDYCPKCGKNAGEPGWKISFDKEVCKDLMDVVSGYKMGIKNIDDVSTVVNAYGITDYSLYVDGIKSVLNELTPSVKYEEPTPTVKIKKNKKKWFDTIESVDEKVDVELNNEPKEEAPMFEGMSEE